MEKFLTAIIGFIGVLIGSIATIIRPWFDQKLEAKKDEPRKQLLKKMLEHPRFKWRKLDTLMNVIGADEETTKRLLIEIGARGSEDGKPLWSLIKYNPLPETEP